MQSRRRTIAMVVQRFLWSPNGVTVVATGRDWLAKGGTMVVQGRQKYHSNWYPMFSTVRIFYGRPMADSCASILWPLWYVYLPPASFERPVSDRPHRRPSCDCFEPAQNFMAARPMCHPWTIKATFVPSTATWPVLWSHKWGTKVAALVPNHCGSSLVIMYFSSLPWKWWRSCDDAVRRSTNCNEQGWITMNTQRFSSNRCDLWQRHTIFEHLKTFNDPPWTLVISTSNNFWSKQNKPPSDLCDGSRFHVVCLKITTVWPGLYYGVSLPILVVWVIWYMRRNNAIPRESGIRNLLFEIIACYRNKLN